MNKTEPEKPLEITLFSFGFKHGVPDDITLMFDVRILPNPYWEEGMRHLTGLDMAVSEYVVQSEAGEEFLSRCIALLDFLIEKSIQSGKKEMRIGIGCTGGQHRSVAIAEQLCAVLSVKPVIIHLYHRDIDKK